MARTSVATFETSAPGPLPPGVTGAAEARGYFGGDGMPLQLHVLGVASDTAITLEPSDTDRLAYVWRGEVEAGEHRLEAGSSLIVEHGASLKITGQADESRIALFAASSPRPNQRGGGVYLLPRERVPRVGANASGTQGGLHANGKGTGCELWMNENTLPPYPEAPPPEEASKGVHMHPEDEIIFVTGGNIRLGSRLYEAGAALAVTRDTFYGFHLGPAGLSFVTFRPSATNQIRFAGGGGYIHSDFWDGIGAIDYAKPATV